MPTSILIAFQYTTKPLPGALIDLYHAMKWCLSFQCKPHILTDITSVQNLSNLKQAIDTKIADDDLLNFFNVELFGNPIRNSIQLLEKIVTILNEPISDKKLILYYSGHGIREYMIMPDNGRLPFIEFRDHIIRMVPPDVEIFWILDCCNPNGLYLPYKLQGNTFRLSSSKIQCVTHPILLITSSDSDEKSIATKSGSLKY